MKKARFISLILVLCFFVSLGACSTKPNAGAELPLGVGIFYDSRGAFVKFGNDENIRVYGFDGDYRMSENRNSIVFQKDDDVFLLKRGENEAKRFIDNVYLGSSYFWFKDLSKPIYYIANISEVSSLMCLAPGNEEASVVDTDVYNIVGVSPKGTKCLYTKYSYIDGSISYGTDIYLNGEKTVLTTSEVGNAKINDDGYIVYQDASADYYNPDYYIAKLGAEEPSVCIGKVSQMYTNAAETLYSKDGDTYLCAFGQEPVKVLDEEITSLVRNIGIDDFDSFIGKYVLADDGSVYKIGSSADKSVKILANVDYAYLSEERKSMFFEKNGSFYITDKIDKMAEHGDPVIQDSVDVNGYRFTRDMSYICYLNKDGELFCQKTSEKTSIRLASDIIDSRRFAILYTRFDDCYCYYVSEDKLYLSINGGEGTLIEGVTGKALYVHQSLFNDYVIAADEEYQYIIRGTEVEVVCENRLSY